MLLPLLTLTVAAQTWSPAPRVDETLTRKRWWTVREPAHEPARPTWRNRRGAWDCWTWPDGVAARCRELKGRRLLAEVRFDVFGRRATTVRFDGDDAAEVLVHGVAERTVDLTGWVDTRVGRFEIAAPVVGVDDGDGWTWSDGESQLRATLADDGVDLFGNELVETIEQTCVCRVEDRTTTLVDGRLALRVRLRHLATERPQVSELWAVPGPAQTLMLGYTVDGGEDLVDIQRRLAVGRAVVARIRTVEEGE